MTAKLILSLDGELIQEYSLNKERMTIGRKADNDIVINNLAVSSQHAAIITILNDSFMEDMDSTNGLLVNGVPTKKHFLQNNDVIEIGKYVLKYLNDNVSNTSAEDFEKTMVMRVPAASVRPYAEKSGDTGYFQHAPGMAVKPAVEPAPDRQLEASPRDDLSRDVPGASSLDASESAASGVSPQLRDDPSAIFAKSQEDPPRASKGDEPQVVARGGMFGVSPTLRDEPSVAAVTPRPVALAAIQILNGPNAGKELDLVKGLTTLGKPGVQVAVLTRRPQGFFITHVEGAVFPSVNGQLLGSQPCPLSDHDLIELAGVKMEFYFKS